MVLKLCQSTRRYFVNHLILVWSLIVFRLEMIAERLLELYVRHTCLIRGLSEGGRLKIVADMTQLELAMSSFCRKFEDLGSSYKLFRAFRFVATFCFVVYRSFSGFFNCLKQETVNGNKFCKNNKIYSRLLFLGLNNCWVIRSCNGKTLMFYRI